MNEIFNSAISALQTARTMTEDRLIQFSKYPPYIHALEQIKFIARILEEERVPTQQEKDHIDIGLMAIKEFDASEPEYSDALSELSFQFKKLV